MIEGKERSYCRHAFPNVAPHQEPTLRIDVITERQLPQIAAVDRQNDAPQKPAQHDAASALIGSEIVVLALGIIELLLPCLDVHVGVGQFAKIYLGTRHVETGHSALDGHVAQE